MRHNALSTPVAALPLNHSPRSHIQKSIFWRRRPPPPNSLESSPDTSASEAKILRREAQEQNSILEKDRQHASGPPTSPNPADRTQHDLEHQAEVALLKARTFEVRADAADASQPKG